MEGTGVRGLRRTLLPPPYLPLLLLLPRAHVRKVEIELGRSECLRSKDLGDAGVQAFHLLDEKSDPKGRVICMEPQAIRVQRQGRRELWPLPCCLPLD